MGLGLSMGNTKVDSRSLPISGTACIVLDQVDSTNAYLGRLVFNSEVEAPNKPLAVVGLAQSAGRGRTGNSWQSNQGNLALSLLCHPTRPMAQWACLSLVVAVSLARVLKQKAGLTAQVKWPNDLLVDQAKIIGILPEVVRDNAGNNPSLVIGIGLNLAQAPSIPGRATTSIAALAPHIDLDVLSWTDAICAAVLEDLAIWEQQGFNAFQKQWMAHAFGIGDRLTVRLPSKSFEATMLGLAIDGSLQVRSDTGKVMEVTSGEVFFGEIP